jgi:hypothetical protein
MTNKNITRDERRRYQGVRRFIRVYGLTKEEAEARYDRPKGVCKVCGGPASTRRKLYCVGCEADVNNERAKAAYRAKKTTRSKAPKPQLVPGRKRGGRGEGISISQPVHAPQCEVVIVPDGLEITRIPSLMPDGVRGRGPELWDEDPEKARWVEKVLERMNRRKQWDFSMIR